VVLMPCNFHCGLPLQHSSALRGPAAVYLQDPDANVTYHVLFGLPGQLSLTPCPSNTSTKGCAAYAVDSQVGLMGAHPQLVVVHALMQS
jgi:hypothetical protein